MLTALMQQLCCYCNSNHCTTLSLTVTITVIFIIAFTSSIVIVIVIITGKKGASPAASLPAPSRLVDTIEEGDEEEAEREEIEQEQQAVQKISDDRAKQVHTLFVTNKLELFKPV
jgi:hypothetical protein